MLNAILFKQNEHVKLITYQHVILVFVNEIHSLESKQVCSLESYLLEQAHNNV